MSDAQIKKAKNAYRHMSLEEQAAFRQWMKGVDAQPAREMGWQPPSNYDEIVRLKIENALLKARMDVDAAYHNGGMPAIYEVVARERIWLEEMKQAIQDAMLRAENAERDTYQKLIDEKGRYEAESKELPIPLTIEQIDRMVTTLDHIRVEGYNETAKAIQKRGVTSLQEALTYAMERIALAGGREVQINLLRQLPTLFTNPYTVCFELMKECLELGAPDVATASRLDKAWVQENISTGRPLTPQLLCDALFHARRYIKEFSRNDSARLNMGRYASKNNLTDDNLHKYLGYYNQIKKFAAKASDDLKGDHPNVLKEDV